VDGKRRAAGLVVYGDLVDPEGLSHAHRTSTSLLRRRRTTMKIKTRVRAGGDQVSLPTTCHNHNETLVRA
jgi:hypothetical protein